MDAILWLAGAAAALAFGGRFAGRRGWCDAAALLLAVAAGVTLPDIDALLGLPHRSGLTHGLLPGLVALMRRPWRPVAAGLLIGIGFHLAADAFPRAMTGFATVKLPLAGSLGGAGSRAWLAINSAGATLAGVLLTERLFHAPARVALLSAAAVIGVVYLAGAGGGWQALAVYAAASWLFWRWAGR